MKKQLITILLTVTTMLLFGQTVTEERSHDIGVNYYGELGFRPGVEIDYGLQLWRKSIDREKRTVGSQLNLRPSIAYYHYSHYSNNFLLSTKLNYQLKFVKKSNSKYVFVEPFVKVGYLRYFLSGKTFQTQTDGFSNAKFKGSNSIVFGGGIDFGGYLSKSFDWLMGFDYYAENTEDELVLHRFVAKLGLRIKLN